MVPGMVGLAFGLNYYLKHRAVCVCADVCTCRWKSMRALTLSLSLSSFLTHARTHAIKQSASDQSLRSLPVPPPPLPSSAIPVLLLLCRAKHDPSNSSLEDTKTSSYLTPGTNLERARCLGASGNRTQTRQHWRLSEPPLQQEESIQSDRQSACP